MNVARRYSSFAGTCDPEHLHFYPTSRIGQLPLYEAQILDRLFQWAWQPLAIGLCRGARVTTTGH